MLPRSLASATPSAIATAWAMAASAGDLQPIRDVQDDFRQRARMFRRLAFEPVEAIRGVHDGKHRLLDLPCARRGRSRTALQAECGCRGARRAAPCRRAKRRVIGVLDEFLLRAQADEKHALGTLRQASRKGVASCRARLPCRRGAARHGARGQTRHRVPSQRATARRPRTRRPRCSPCVAVRGFRSLRQIP
jgi:hypothetical protein